MQDGGACEETLLKTRKQTKGSEERKKKQHSQREGRREQTTASNSFFTRAWERYWFKFRISYGLLVFFRFVFFTAFAFDCWTQIHRAAKYSRCVDFNIPHISPAAEAWVAQLAAYVRSHQFWQLTVVNASCALAWVWSAFANVLWLFNTIPGNTSMLSPDQLASFWESFSLLPPTPASLIVCWALMAFVALRIAFGRAQRWELLLLTALQFYHYYSSQLNLFQHEHLLAIIALVWCFVDWDQVEAEAQQSQAT